MNPVKRFRKRMDKITASNNLIESIFASKRIGLEVIEQLRQLNLNVGKLGDINASLKFVVEGIKELTAAWRGLKDPVKSNRRY